MKKSLIFILILFLISPTMAIETTLQQEYKAGQTLITEISGNFIDNIKPSDILFYSGRLFVPMIYDVAKIKDKFYLYALLPNKVRNYTLIIKQARYFEAGQERKEDLKYNFSVSGNTTLFSVNPGFIVTNKNFNIKVTSQLKSINLISKFLNSTQNISLAVGKSKTLFFPVSEIKNFTFTSLSLEAEDTKYEIPVAIFREAEQIPVPKDLRFSKPELNLTVLKNSNFQFELKIFNTGQEDIENISLSSNLEIVNLEPENIENLSAGTSKKINLTVNSDEGGTEEGFLSATSVNQTAEILLYITTIEDKQQFETVVSKAEITEESCSNLGGKKCDEEEECEGTTKLTLEEGLCCIGECREKKESGLGKTITLIAILILLSIIGFFIYKKLKTRGQTPEDVLKKKSENYGERFKAKPEQIRGGLSKV
jgi:hypothetical protein